MIDDQARFASIAQTHFFQRRRAVSNTSSVTGSTEPVFARITRRAQRRPPAESQADQQQHRPACRARIRATPPARPTNSPTRKNSTPLSSDHQRRDQQPELDVAQHVIHHGRILHGDPFGLVCVAIIHAFDQCLEQFAELRLLSPGRSNSIRLPSRTRLKPTTSHKRHRDHRVQRHAPRRDIPEGAGPLADPAGDHQADQDAQRHRQPQRMGRVRPGIPDRPEQPGQRPPDQRPLEKAAFADRAVAARSGQTAAGRTRSAAPPITETRSARRPGRSTNPRTPAHSTLPTVVRPDGSQNSPVPTTITSKHRRQRAVDPGPIAPQGADRLRRCPFRSRSRRRSATRKIRQTPATSTPAFRAGSARKTIAAKAAVAMHRPTRLARFDKAQHQPGRDDAPAASSRSPDSSCATPAAPPGRSSAAG